MIDISRLQKHITKRGVIRGAAVVSLLFAVWFIATHSIVRIIAAEGSALQLKQHGGTIQTATSSMIAIVHTGDYVIMSSHKAMKTKQEITVKPLSVLSIILKHEEQKQINPVTSLPLQSGIASTNSLRYINANGRLLTIDQRGTSQATKDIGPLRNITTTNNMIVATDTASIIESGSSSQSMFDKPNPGGTSSITSAVATNSGSVAYVIQGDTLYKRSGAAYSSLGSIPSSAILLAGSDSHVVYLAPTKQDDDTLSGLWDVVVYIPDKHSRATIHQTTLQEGFGTGIDAGWSPDNSLAAMTFGDKLLIYDAKSSVFSELAITETGSAVVWIDNTNLVYADADGLWKYDVSQHISTLIAENSSSFVYGDSVYDATAKQLSSMVYFRDGRSALYRVLLDHKQTDPSHIEDLFRQDILHRSDSCDMYYLNISQPTLLAVINPDALRDTPGYNRFVCELTIQRLLREAHIEPNQILVDYRNDLPSGDIPQDNPGA